MSDITIGEVHRDLERATVRHDQDVDRLDRRIDSSASHERMAAAERRIDSLESWRTWLGRVLAVAVFTSLVAPILVAVVIANVLGGG